MSANSRFRASLPVLLLLVVAHICQPVARAQSGTIVGTITDESGAAVADASVHLLNTASGFSRVVSTNGSGQYGGAQYGSGQFYPEQKIINLGANIKF